MSDSRCWFAPLPDRPGDAWAAAEAWEADGTSAGWLVAWRRPAKPVRDALEADPRAFDPAGPPAWASLVWVPPEVRIVFDDLAVQHARQRAMAEGTAVALTTFPRDPSTFGGALSAWRGDDAAARALEDPFARVFGARRLLVGAGLLGRSAVLPGPVVERYGGRPWPADRFSPG